MYQEYECATPRVHFSRIVVSSVADFFDAVCDILPTLREMDIEIWLINDARIPGLVLPEGMIPMDINPYAAGG